ncbi:MAG: nitroreductase family protein [Verrucomicrobiae bacterium]|nr:nitroreductase family protein [Verrucomicrobiae bacterium]
MLQFTINAERCIRCRRCVTDCPVCIIEQKEKEVPFIRPEQEENCLRCQHCLAVCPTAALSILGKKPEASLPLDAAHMPNLDQMTLLIRGRRSFRQYQDKNVDPELLQQLLATLANSPTGINNRRLTFRLIDDREAMNRLREKVMTGLNEAAKANRIPERAAYLTNTIAPYFEQRRDIIFRNAPHALIVSAEADAPCPQQDVALALAYFELLAQSAGLGTVWWGMLHFVLATLPDIRTLLGIPPDHVFYAMLFGRPAIKYSRTVQRDNEAEIRHIIF